MNIDDFFEMYTGGNDNISTWKPFAVKEFAEAYHKKQLSLLNSSLQLPCEEEMLMKRHYELIKAKENLTEVDNGSFYAGFRRCFNWLKPYEVDDKAIVQNCNLVKFRF